MATFVRLYVTLMTFCLVMKTWPGVLVLPPQGRLMCPRRDRQIMNDSVSPVEFARFYPQITRKSRLSASGRLVHGQELWNSAYYSRDVAPSAGLLYD